MTITISKSGVVSHRGNIVGRIHPHDTTQDAQPVPFYRRVWRFGAAEEEKHMIEGPSHIKRGKIEMWDQQFLSRIEKIVGR